MATTLSFCGEFSLNKSCAGRANNTWRSWAWAEREQGWWAEAVCAPGWGSGTGRRRRMPPSAPGNTGGERVSACLALPCPGWVGSGSSVPARTKALEWNCPQLLLLLAGVGSQQRTNDRDVTGHWEIAGLAEAADPSALAPLPRLNSLRKPVSLCPN